MACEKNRAALDWVSLETDPELEICMLEVYCRTPWGLSLGGVSK